MGSWVRALMVLYAIHTQKLQTIERKVVECVMLSCANVLPMKNSTPAFTTHQHQHQRQPLLQPRRLEERSGTHSHARLQVGEKKDGGASTNGVQWAFDLACVLDPRLSLLSTSSSSSPSLALPRSASTPLSLPLSLSSYLHLFVTCAERRMWRKSMVLLVRLTELEREGACVVQRQRESPEGQGEMETRERDEANGGAVNFSLPARGGGVRALSGIGHYTLSVHFTIHFHL